MCGIHGFVTAKKNDLHADDFVGQGFITGSLRGIDASGVASISPAKNISWQRLPVSGPMFVTEKYAQTLIRAACHPNTITIAHTRASSPGMVEGISGAHPFYVDQEEDGVHSMIGVHNGFLQSWRRQEDASKFNVDSEWALNHIYKYGKKAFENIDGAFVFAWWDNFDPDTLNLALNSQRPMHIAFTEDGNMAYASEPGMLAWLMERNGIKRAGKVLQLQANNWYQFNQSDLTKYDKEKLLDYKSPAIVVTSTSQRFNQRTEHKSVMASVREVLASNASTTPAVRTYTLVTKEEVDNAETLAVLNLKGEFYPDKSDFISKTLEGYITFEEVIMDAIIPDGFAMNWVVNKPIAVRCIGINAETGKDVAICTVDTSVSATPVAPKQVIRLPVASNQASS